MQVDVLAVLKPTGGSHIRFSANSGRRYNLNSQSLFKNAPTPDF
jgi:hypothetical protein